MRDDAIAPIIAVMLILAAIVTFFSIWNAVYVPSMKESAEVGHLENVESAFEHFSSDLDYAASSYQNNLIFSEPVQLGGGDVMVNLLKSSGTLQVQNETDPIYTLDLTDGTGNTVALVNGTIVNFSYEPVSNFWQDQGYQWQYGYINVTKYGELSTPLEYYNMTDVENEISTPGSLQTFAQSFGMVSATPNMTSQGYGNISSLDLWVVSMYANPVHTSVSSNGIGTLRLTSNVNTTSYTNIAEISVGSNDTLFGPGVLGSWYSGFSKISTTYSGYPANIIVDNSPGVGNYLYYNSSTVNQPMNTPVTVNLHQVNIEISAY